MEIRIAMNTNTYNEIKHYQPALVLYLTAITFGSKVNNLIKYKVEAPEILGLTTAQLRRAINTIKNARGAEIIAKGAHNSKHKEEFGTEIILNAHNFIQGFKLESPQGDIKAADHLSMSFEQYEALCNVYTKQEVDKVIQGIANYSANYKYKYLHLTVKQWIERDRARQQQDKKSFNNQTRQILQ